MMNFFCITSAFYIQHNEHGTYISAGKAGKPGMAIGILVHKPLLFCFHIWINKDVVCIEASKPRMLYAKCTGHKIQIVKVVLFVDANLQNETI